MSKENNKDNKELQDKQKAVTEQKSGETGVQKKRDSEVEPDGKASGSASQKNDEATQKGHNAVTGEILVDKTDAQVAPGLIVLAKDISELEDEKSRLEKRLSDLQGMLKPIKTADKRLYGKTNKTPEQEKVLAEVEIEKLKGRIDWLKEEIGKKKAKLKALAQIESESLALQRLIDRSHQVSFLKKNKYFIKNSLQKILNSFVNSEDPIIKASFEKVRKLAFKEGEEGIAEFNKAFGELLKAANKTIHALSSGRLKNELYGAVKLTLQLWNPQEPFIGKLVFPEDLQEDVKKAPDLFIANKTLITSLILGLLNQTLQEKRQEIVALRNLARSPEDKDNFMQAITDFVDREDEDVFQIGAGGLRERLNETLRLTLLNWQPELPGGFEKVIIAED